MKYQHEGNTFLVYEDELFVKVKSASPIIQEPIAAVQPRRKNTRTVIKAHLSTGRKSRAHLTNEDKRLIKEELESGVSGEAICEKYGISAATVYRLRGKGNSGEPLKLSVRPQGYVRPVGHRFKSKLPMSHARCPDCHELADVPEDEPEIEEGEV